MCLHVGNKVQSCGVGGQEVQSLQDAGAPIVLTAVWCQKLTSWLVTSGCQVVKNNSENSEPIRFYCCAASLSLHTDGAAVLHVLHPQEDTTRNSHQILALDTVLFLTLKKIARYVFYFIYFFVFKTNWYSNSNWVKPNGQAFWFNRYLKNITFFRYLLGI